MMLKKGTIGDWKNQSPLPFTQGF